FHQANQERLRASPHALVATSTHDTKRSEDARARISVLSELAPAWDEAVDRWRAVTAADRTDLDGEGEFAPDANEEYLFHQAVLGTFPFGDPDPGALRRYAD